MYYCSEACLHCRHGVLVVGLGMRDAVSGWGGGWGTVPDLRSEEAALQQSAGMAAVPLLPFVSAVVV